MSPLRWVKYKRNFFLTSLIVYLIILLLAATPLTVTNPVAQWLRKKSVNLLHDVAITPGLYLFHVHYGEWRWRRFCASVWEEADGKSVNPLYLSNETCRPQRLHLFVDPYAVMLSRLFHEIILAHTYKNRARTTALVSSIGDFFCHSHLVPNHLRQPSFLQIYLEQEVQALHTGVLQHAPVFFYRWNCEKYRISEFIWSPNPHDPRLVPLKTAWKAQ